MADDDGSVLTGNPTGDDPATEPAWNAGLEDYQETIDAKGWKSSADVLQSYVHLEKAVGADKVVLPAEDSNILEWEGWSRLGTPESADGYAMAAPEGFEHYDAGLSDDMRSTFHEARLTPAQATMIHDKFVERMMGSLDQQVTDNVGQVETWTGELRQEYGTAYDERIAVARNAIREFGTPALAEILNSSGLGNHPEVVRAFVKAGIALGKGGQFKEGEQAGNFGTTPDMAKIQIAEVRAHPGLMDPTHAEHAVLQQKLTRLTELAFGTDLVAKAG